MYKYFSFGIKNTQCNFARMNFDDQGGKKNKVLTAIKRL